MAKVIEFYVPDRLRERRLWSPPEQRGKVIDFPLTEAMGVSSQLDGANPISRSQSMVPFTTTSSGDGVENQEPRRGT
jgi:hypothetical protein